MLNKKEIKSRIEECIKQFQEIETLYDDCYKLLGCDPESKFFTILYNTHTKYVKTLSESINDDFNWIDWYIWENDCGKKEYEAKASKWKKEKKIKNVEDLVNIILADLE